MSDTHFRLSDSVGGGPVPAQKPVCYVVLPRADSKACFHSAINFAHASQRHMEIFLDKDAQGAAFLRNHNGPWHNAMNLRRLGHPITHFAMIHADVAPHGFGWLDILYEEMQAAKAQVIGTVIPFRDFSGLTSVGIDNPYDEFAPRRLTMQECHRLPETFGSQQANELCPLPEWSGETTPRPLLINTGLLLADITQPWADEVVFDFKVRIGRVKEAVPQPNGAPTIPAGHAYFEQESEDWRFSRFLAQRGVPYVATRKVLLDHIGEWSWSNRAPQFDLRNGQCTSGMATDEIWQNKLRMDGAEMKAKLLAAAREEGRQAGLKEAMIDPAFAPQFEPVNGHDERFNAVAQVGGD